MNFKQTILLLAFLFLMIGLSSDQALAQTDWQTSTASPRRAVMNVLPLSSQRTAHAVPMHRTAGNVSLQRVNLAQGLVPMQPQPHNVSGGMQMMPVDPAALSIRIKDITSIEGHRVNHLSGVGLVTGLKGTGGKSPLTQDLAANMLKSFGVLTPDIQTGSMAAVTVSAKIPAFAKVGHPVTATVSVMDDATSLYGGALLATSLKGYDGQYYAVARGPLVVGGFSAGGDGAAISKNHDVAAKVEAILEIPINSGPAFPGQSYRLLLRNRDYATAYRIATEINRLFPGHARAMDQGSVNVVFPAAYRQAKMRFVVLIDEMRVTPDTPARVVINQKSGTIVVGQNVRLSKLMFAVGNLIVTTTETPVVSQPAPLSDGQTVVVPRTSITATETGGRYNMINQQTTVGELAAALNMLGVTPQDLISVFKTIEASGALQAELVIE